MLTPGHITLYMRFGSKTCSFLCSPEIRFESMKVSKGFLSR